MEFIATSLELVICQSVILNAVGTVAGLVKLSAFKIRVPVGFDPIVFLILIGKLLELFVNVLVKTTARTFSPSVRFPDRA